MGELSLRHVTVTIDDGFGRLTLNAPQQRNALSDELVGDALTAMAHLADQNITIAVLDAAPPVFCAGVDLRRPISAARGSPDLLLFEALSQTPIFWIAAVNGPALAAGMVVAALCPMTIASEDAWFSLPELQLGIYPGRVATYLERVVPRRTVLTWSLTGDRIPAAHARDLGLVSELAEPGGAVAAAQGWARRLGQLDPSFVDAAGQSWRHVFTTDDFHARDAAHDRLLRENLADRGRPVDH